MKIDSHQHFWNYNSDEYGWIDESMSVLKQDFLPEHLQLKLKTIGFEGSVAVQARQSLAETNWLLDLAGKNSFIKGVVGWVDLCSEQVLTQIEHFASHPKAVGLRHVIHDEDDLNFILRDDFIRGVHCLEQFDLAYDILIFPKHLQNARIFVENFSEKQTFVLDHIAKPLIKQQLFEPWKADLQKLAARPNVYCKLSGMVTEADWTNWKPEDLTPYLEHVLETFGVDRVMIGSDWPVCQLAGEYERVMAVVIDFISKLSPSERALILGENAIKAYKLKF